MNKRNLDPAIAVIFSILGIIVPVLFHMLGLGSVFLPMFLPLAAGAFLMSPGYALLTGIMTPLFSALLTGMPPFYPPIAILMMIELGAFCFLISLLKSKSRLNNITILVISILAERILMVVLYYFVMPLFKINFGVISFYAIMKSFPGIILMLIIVPLFVPAASAVIEKRKLRLYEFSKEE